MLSTMSVALTEAVIVAALDVHKRSLTAREVVAHAKKHLDTRLNLALVKRSLERLTNVNKLTLAHETAGEKYFRLR